LRVINWAGLPGAVSYSFDDANSSQIQNYATLQALGVPMTFYLLTSKVEAGSATWAQAIKDGHELGNHTQTHNSVPSASDIEAAQTFIQQKFGVRAWTFAAPNGANSAYLPYTQPKFFLSRGVSNGLIAPNGSTDPWNLPAFIPASGAPASAFNSQMDAAKAANSWRIVLVHGFTGGTDGAYQPVTLSAFTSSVQYAKSIGMWADTVTKIGAYWRGQKAVSAATTTTSGTTKTYNWTLPANFPPGKCLRVTADGGTLKQGGKTLVWNDRGYYEISLDLGAVTISP
jgi:peptidoglycan/xylan/chitin deacetylase (PgdA/CDA1 family)